MNARTVTRPTVWIVMLVLMLMGVGLAAGLRPARAESPSPDRPVVLRIGWNMKVDSLNPFIGIESTSYALYHLNYDYLTQTDPKTLEPAPSLAASWTSSDDLKTWTFKLRDDVKFQDGEPLTAADVVYSIELNLSDEIGNYDAYVTGIESCKAIDDHTVEFRLLRAASAHPHESHARADRAQTHLEQDVDRRDLAQVPEQAHRHRQRSLPDRRVRTRQVRASQGEPGLLG